MTSWLNNVGNWGLGLVALAVGIFLIIVAIISLAQALGGKDKQWGKALEGLAVGVIGGLLGWWGASSIISFMRRMGNEVPHS